MNCLETLHTFGLTGHAHRVIDLDEGLSRPLNDSPLWILGEGSNCAFVEDFEGTVVRVVNKGKTIRDCPGFYEVTAQAGECWHELVQFCNDNQVYGFENLALIPGTVGAAPIQNIGAYGVEVNRYIETVRGFDVLTGSALEFSNQECQFGYRNSLFKRELLGKVIITSVTFRLPKAWEPTIHYGELNQLTHPSPTDVFNKVIQIRQRKLPDPKKIGNAGSFFKNPLVSKKHFAALKGEWQDMPHYEVDHNSVKVPAAYLIDQLGFKGKTVGNIQCHPQHALVLCNLGGGTGQQLLDLARDIQSKVENTFSIRLEPEVRLVGRVGMVTL